MNGSIDRRQFLGGSVAALTLPRTRSRTRPRDDAIALAVIGLNARGAALMRGFAALDGVTIGHLCDVDSRALARAHDDLAKRQQRPAKQSSDLRRVFDDAGVDAVVIATPDHWHAPAAIAACQAGKHVYVEKPCSHNGAEGEMLVQAARTHGRKVQMGNQRRSWPGVVEAIAALHAGRIGRVYHARAWYANGRGSTGRRRAAAVPAWLDWDLWQGPAPRRPFASNIVHYKWHWYWHWGTGELGNNGVHALDLCRWGLAGDYPTRVTSAGGRHAFDDDQETPDTQIATFEFGAGTQVVWEGLSCNRRGIDGAGFGASFHGDAGSLAITGSDWVVYDPAGKEVERHGQRRDDAAHYRNFLAAIRDGAELNAEIESGHRSTVLCHLGNIAQRVGRDLRCAPGSGRILDDAAAMRLWRREYAPGFAPKV